MLEFIEWFEIFMVILYFIKEVYIFADTLRSYKKEQVLQKENEKLSISRKQFILREDSQILNARDQKDNEVRRRKRYFYKNLTTGKEIE